MSFDRGKPTPNCNYNVKHRWYRDQFLTSWRSIQKRILTSLIIISWNWNEISLMTDTVGSLGLTIDTTTLVLFCVARDAMVWADFLSIIYLKQKTMITRQHTDRISDYPPCSEHRLPFLQDSLFRHGMLPLNPVFCRLTPIESWITSWAIVKSVVKRVNHGKIGGQ